MPQIDMTIPEAMNSIALALDRILNGEDVMKQAMGGVDGNKIERKNGFVLILYPFGDKTGRCNFISNGASQEDVISMFERQIEAFKQKEQSHDGTGQA